MKKDKKDKKAAPERDTIILCGVPPPRDGLGGGKGSGQPTVFQGGGLGEP